MSEHVVVESEVTPRLPLQYDAHGGQQSSQSSLPCIFDRFVKPIMTRGHGLLALCFFFSSTEERVTSEIIRLGLPRPQKTPHRISKRADAWTVEQIQQLMLLWPTNLFASCIGERIGRSAGSVRYKAKWLGLPVRNRADLLRDVDDEAALAETRLLPAEVSRRKRTKIDHTWDTDLLIGEHCLHLCHPSVSAQALGRTTHQIECRKGSIELPSLHFARGRLKMEYDPNSPRAEPFLSQDWIMRRCNRNPRAWFWTMRRSGQFTAEATKKSKTYQAELSGLDETGGSYDSDD